MAKKSDIRLGYFIKSKREYLNITQQEVADYVGVSKSAVSRWESGDIGNMGIDKVPKLSEILEISPMELINMDKEHQMERVPNRSNTNPIPLLGQIAAGTPALAEENIEDYFNLDSKIKADFALKVKGNSMLAAGIYPNDIVFIKEQPNLENGEIGAILIENEATLKKFYKEGNTIVLQPENDTYKPIILTNGNVKILGKLVAVLSMFE
jgi:repressor LexA